MTVEIVPTYPPDFTERKSAVSALPAIREPDKLLHHARCFAVSNVAGQLVAGGSEIDVVTVEIWGRFDGAADVGLYSALTADDARVVAAALLTAADAVDGGTKERAS